MHYPHLLLQVITKDSQLFLQADDIPDQIIGRMISMKVGNLVTMFLIMQI